MSGNWDDSGDSDADVVVVEKPLILPRARQPSIAKSIEKAVILESSVAGSTKDSDASSDDESESVGSAASEESLEAADEVLVLDFDTTTSMKKHTQETHKTSVTVLLEDELNGGVEIYKMITQFECVYRNIISEFADVEIFAISLDSLVVECLAHSYHDWTLAGQSVVLTKQIDRFLQQFVDFGGKFKLIVFTDFASMFARDTTLAFARATAIAHICTGPYAKDLLYFSSPVDPEWAQFLHDLTPSFLMISVDNVTREACAQEDLDITPQLETIVIDVLSQAIPVVLLSSVVVNFSSVFAYYINPKLCIKYNWESFAAAHWECNSMLLKMSKSPTEDASSITSAADLWTQIIIAAKKSDSISEHFEALCCAVLLSALISSKRGPNRLYLPEKQGAKRGLDVIKDRRLLLTTATMFLEKLNFATVKFSFSDFWDGRMVISCFDVICANEPILPYRIQEEFARLHTKAALTKPIATDTAEKLFDPIPETANPLSSLSVMYTVKSPLVDKYIPEMKTAHAETVFEDGRQQDYVAFMQEKMSWKLRPIEEEFTKKVEVVTNEWQRKRANKARQQMSRWYEMFANSLEGRGTNLLVDFSRIPKGHAMIEDATVDNAPKKAGKAWSGQKGGGGGKKGGKEAAKSKKDLILEANKKAKDSKLIEGEKNKIKFATQQGRNAVQFLERCYTTFELPESKALCAYEILIREGRDLLGRLTGPENLEARRVQAVTFVGRLKDCLVTHWPYLESKQKEQVVDLWAALGFEVPAGMKASAEAKMKRLDLGMNMIYYQLEYGGELIDIQSDPRKDDRVTGFAPDAWQRKMLDSVDRGNSAIIVAPTSAGKTFVSYYCIEKVLRASDDDVVVYVSPSKALINQVCGSVYARFRNKSMTRGKSLFGTLNPEHSQNPLQCQVLVTVPESLEALMLSTNPKVQEFVSHIKYVVFDEVHSIGASPEAHIWEHLLLLIQCPFLALSATIGNAAKLHAWLDNAEQSKTDHKRKVDLIIHHERYSELELSIMRVEKPQPIEANINNDLEVASSATPDSIDGDIIEPFMPYGVFMPEKIRMFGIPDDQQLTARQILQLYTTMASVDEKTKTEFEPCNFYGYKASEPLWLSRSALRKLENGLKQRLLQWLAEDEQKLKKVLNKLAMPIDEQLKHRAVPFNKEKLALENIVRIVDEMNEKNMLPAMCFNDDRSVCENLAIRLCKELEDREMEFMNSAEFKTKYAIKDEDKIVKLAKRKRDMADKKKGEKNEDEDEKKETEELDPLAAQRARLKQVLAKFRLRGRGGGDQDLYDKMTERMRKGSRGRESTRMLLRLFERGIGYHHGALNNAEKGAVEVLYRSGHLAIIFTTSTLALGVNMPCKTVLFGVDTPLLTPLLFRQMSGRAGRRGFDHSGNVCFMSVPTSKMRRLLTASLSTLQGNPPFSTSFILRALSYVHAKDAMAEDRTGPISTFAERAKSALSLFQHSFSLFTRREAQNGTLQKQLRLYAAYSIQLLRHLQLLTENCVGKNLAGLAATLAEVSTGEPGNLLFIHLLQRGAFHVMIKQNPDKNKLRLKMVTILANLFTRERLPHWFQMDDKNSYPAEAKNLIFLTGLPNEMQHLLDEYNEFAVTLYQKFMAAASSNHNLVAPEFAVGHYDTKDVFLKNELVPPVFEGYSHDSSFMPVINFNQKDHRGRKIWYNAFAVAFWVHESRQKLLTLNQIRVNQMWYLLHDFIAILQRLAEGLEAVARQQDPVAELIRDIHSEYNSKFCSAFGMKNKNN